MQLLVIRPLFWGPPRLLGLRSYSAPFWAPEKARLMRPFLILPLFLGPSQKVGVM